MTNPVRLFSMLTTRTPPLGAVGISTKTELDQALAAALCGGMPKKWFLAARVKWCLDFSGIKYLKYQLWQEAAGIAHEEKWKIPKGKEYIRKMSEMAIIELMQPEVYSQLGAWHLKVNYIECGKSQWFDVWCGRYETIYQHLNDWTNSAYGYLQKRQRNS